MTHFVNPKEIDGYVVPYLVNMTKRGADQIGADYTFDCMGNTKVMRQALETSHRGWGKSVVIGTAGAGQEISTRPFQLVTGRTWMSTAFDGARSRHLLAIDARRCDTRPPGLALRSPLPAACPSIFGIGPFNP